MPYRPILLALPPNSLYISAPRATCASTLPATPLASFLRPRHAQFCASPIRFLLHTLTHFDSIAMRLPTSLPLPCVSPFRILCHGHYSPPAQNFASSQRDARDCLSHALLSRITLALPTALRFANCATRASTACTAVFRLLRFPDPHRAVRNERLPSITGLPPSSRLATCASLYERAQCLARFAPAQSACTYASVHH